jgi:DNA-binding MarR family transcriptional regulator
MLPVTTAFHLPGDLLPLAYLIKYAHSSLADVVEPVLMHQGFTYIQYAVLLQLRAGIAVNPKRVATQLHYDSGALTRVIDQLVDRGLVERVRRDRDRRKVDLRLTPLASDIIPGLSNLIVEKLEGVLIDFGAAELQELRRLLVRLNVTLQAAAQARDGAELGADFSAGLR